MTRPPTSWFLAYRLLGVRLPEQYRPWVARDVKTRMFIWWRSLRTVLWGAVLVGLFALARHAADTWPTRSTFYRLGLLVLAYALLASGQALVKRELRWQRIDRHGNPVPPRGTAFLGGLEAAIAVAVIAVLFTGGTAAVGYALRPAVPHRCETPSPELVDRIKAGLTKKDVTFASIKRAQFSGGQVVAALLRAPSTDPKRPYEQAFEIWIVRDDGIYGYGHSKEFPGWTDFPEPTSVDRVVPEALQIAVNCVTKASGKLPKR